MSPGNLSATLDEGRLESRAGLNHTMGWGVAWLPLQVFYIVLSFPVVLEWLLQVHDYLPCQLCGCWGLILCSSCPQENFSLFSSFWVGPCNQKLSPLLPASLLVHLTSLLISQGQSISLRSLWNEGKWQLHRCVWLFVIPWTVVHQASLSMEFFRQEYRSRLPFPSARDLPDYVKYIK